PIAGTREAPVADVAVDQVAAERAAPPRQDEPQRGDRRRRPGDATRRLLGDPEGIEAFRERWAGTARLLRPLGLGGASGVSRGLAPVAGGRRRVERWQDGRRREIRPGGGSLDRQRRGSAVA